MKKLLRRFEREKNEKNYDGLCECLKKYEDITILLTDDNGCLIYNSKIKNTWKKYICGKIIYNNVNESKAIISAEQNCKSIFVKDNNVYIAEKIGSVLLTVWDNPELRYFIISVLAVGGLYGLSKLYDMYKVYKTSKNLKLSAEFDEELKNMYKKEKIIFSITSKEGETLEAKNIDEIRNIAKDAKFKLESGKYSTIDINNGKNVIFSYDKEEGLKVLNNIINNLRILG